VKIVLFYHSLLSDWNHGNAHFLRGVATELVRRGHDIRIYEPADGWSYRNLVEQHGEEPLTAFARAYPLLQDKSERYTALDLDRMLEGADLVLVHEWNSSETVNALGAHHAAHPRYRLLFHDTHHRAVTAPHEMERYDLSSYDGVLAYGAVLTRLYLAHGWTRRAWTWHEAADADFFRPLAAIQKIGDLVWIGNWGDDERSAELRAAGLYYGGWLPNCRVPETFAQFRLTVHVPRRPYAQQLVGIPTIRPFEALACGIPLVSAPWQDAEGLFVPGKDFLFAPDGKTMKRHLQSLLAEPERARALAEHGRQTILARHTCAHRVDELLAIFATL
jgi:spore maturation protein CgeB